VAPRAGVSRPQPGYGALVSYKAGEARTRRPAAEENDDAGLRRRVLHSAFWLALTAISLYLVAPTLTQTLGSWRDLQRVQPLWLLVMLASQAASFACLWTQQRLTLHLREWFPIVTSQLAGNALAKVMPGGGAAGAALQYRMLVAAGAPSTETAVGLTVSSLLVFAVLLLLPVLSLPALIGGGAEHSLVEAAWIGFAIFAALFAAGAIALVFDRPLARVAALVERVRNRLLHRREPLKGLPERVLRERDRILEVLGRAWWEALLATVGRWAFDYFTLLAALAGVGARPSPALVLLSFAVAQILAQIPVTPGGLGFVEAGLTATLKLAGVRTGNAVLATFAYRFLSYWLPLAAGAIAAIVHRRRYGGDRSEVVALR
jgi:uncharacterized protein (TIRG00374 family)